jgi:hypothetical protein
MIPRSSFAFICSNLIFLFPNSIEAALAQMSLSKVGPMLGADDGKVLGADDGNVLGLELGVLDGIEEGALLGSDDGVEEGDELGDVFLIVEHVSTKQVVASDPSGGATCSVTHSSLSSSLVGRLNCMPSSVIADEIIDCGAASLIILDRFSELELRLAAQAPPCRSRPGF